MFYFTFASVAKQSMFYISAGWKVEMKEKVEYGIFRGRFEIQLAAWKSKFNMKLE